MDLTAILFALLVLGAIGLVFGLILGFAGKKFAVEEDPRVGEVRACLGGRQGRSVRERLHPRRDENRKGYRRHHGR